MGLLIQKIQNKTIDNMLVLIILPIICIIFSCTFFSQKDNSTVSDIKEIITRYDYQIWLSNLDKKDLRDSTVTYIDTFNSFNRKNWIFALNDSLSLDLPYAMEKDSFFLGNVYCPNLDTIYLQYENKINTLVVSHFDIEKSIDEEMYIYWNHDYGLVALYNYPWGALILFDRETQKGFAKEIFYNDFINRAKERQKVIFEELESQEYR